MAERHLLAGEPPIEIDLRRHARARRITLRVASRDGRVTLTVPEGVPQREALAFAQSKRDWLLAQAGRLAPVDALGEGSALPVEGEMLRIQRVPIRSPRREGDVLLIPQKSRAPGRAVTAYLKVLAREKLVDASDRYAAALDTTYSKITFRDTRTRWGSCSSSGALMYSWRLAMAPPDVLAYVAAHEVAHLKEMNHSPAFWAVVARLMPDYEKHRVWLRREGTVLQRIMLD